MMEFEGPQIRPTAVLAFWEESYRLNKKEEQRL